MRHWQVCWYKFNMVLCLEVANYWDVWEPGLTLLRVGGGGGGGGDITDFCLAVPKRLAVGRWNFVTLSIIIKVIILKTFQWKVTHGVAMAMLLSRSAWLKLSGFCGKKFCLSSKGIDIGLTFSWNSKSALQSWSLFQISARLDKRQERSNFDLEIAWWHHSYHMIMMSGCQEHGYGLEEILFLVVFRGYRRVPSCQVWW